VAVVFDVDGDPEVVESGAVVDVVPASGAGAPSSLLELHAAATTTAAMAAIRRIEAVESM
jgi:hypothetical protein